MPTAIFSEVASTPPVPGGEYVIPNSTETLATVALLRLSCAKPSSTDRHPLGIRAHGPLVVETLGQINRVINTHRSSRHLVGPNLKIDERGATIDCRECSIHCVLPA